MSRTVGLSMILLTNLRRSCWIKLCQFRQLRRPVSTSSDSSYLGSFGVVLGYSCSCQYRSAENLAVPIITARSLLTLAGRHPEHRVPCCPTSSVPLRLDAHIALSCCDVELVVVVSMLQPDFGCAPAALAGLLRASRATVGVPHSHALCLVLAPDCWAHNSLKPPGAGCNGGGAHTWLVLCWSLLRSFWRLIHL